jgi:hypothetical protein
LYKNRSRQQLSEIQSKIRKHPPVKRRMFYFEIICCIYRAKLCKIAVRFQGKPETLLRIADFGFWISKPEVSSLEIIFLILLCQIKTKFEEKEIFAADLRG